MHCSLYAVRPRSISWRCTSNLCLVFSIDNDEQLSFVPLLSSPSHFNLIPTADMNLNLRWHFMSPMIFSWSYIQGTALITNSLLLSLSLPIHLNSAYVLIPGSVRGHDNKGLIVILMVSVDDAERISRTIARRNNYLCGSVRTWSWNEDMILQHDVQHLRLNNWATEDFAKNRTCFRPEKG